MHGKLSARSLYLPETWATVPPVRTRSGERPAGTVVIHRLDLGEMRRAPRGDRNALEEPLLERAFLLADEPSHTDKEVQLPIRSQLFLKPPRILHELAVD